MKYLWVLLVAAMVSACDQGSEVSAKSNDAKKSAVVKEPRGIVFEYGIYNPVRKGRELSSMESNTGKVLRKPVLDHSETTERIPLVKGTYFAYRYRLLDLPKEDAKRPAVEIRKVLVHPEMTLPDGSTSTGWDKQAKGRISVGQVIAFDGYAFSEDYELVEGDWVFQIWYKDQKLVEQKFTTYWPEADKAATSNPVENKI